MASSERDSCLPLSSSFACPHFAPSPPYTQQHINCRRKAGKKAGVLKESGCTVYTSFTKVAEGSAGVNIFPVPKIDSDSYFHSGQRYERQNQAAEFDFSFRWLG
jgi:hypothetical protein